MATLVSCTVKYKNNGANSTSGNQSYKENVIFSPDNHVTLVASENNEAVGFLSEELYNVLGYVPKVITPDKSDGVNEIHIGDIKTDISTTHLLRYSVRSSTKGNFRFAPLTKKANSNIFIRF